MSGSTNTNMQADDGDSATMKPKPTPTPKTLALGKKPLSVRSVVDVARRRLGIVVDDEALDRVSRSRDALIAVAESGAPVYGVTHGVGQNVDRKLLSANQEYRWQDVREESIEANRRLLHSHAAGVGKPLSSEEVRASLLIRAHAILQGQTGCSRDVVQYLTELLQTDSLPQIREVGSVGQADVGLSGALGFAPLARPTLDGRDALSLVSTNAVSMAQACLILEDCRRVLSAAEAVFLAALNGLDGHVDPLCCESLPYQSPRLSPARLEYYGRALQGSHIARTGVGRRIQDPLSFRCSPIVFELAERILRRAERAANEYLNSNEDNPMLLNGGKHFVESTEDEAIAGRIEFAARVLPTAHFCPLMLVVELESLASMLGQVGCLSVQRTLRLSEPQHTGLTRFLGFDESAFGYCALQKIPVALAAELRKESRPSLLDLASMAGGQEDFSTHLPLLLKSLKNQCSILVELAAVELVHACQAMSLRLAADPSVSFGALADRLLERVREVIPIYRDDRQVTPDMDTMRDIVVDLGSSLNAFIAEPSMGPIRAAAPNQ